MYLTPNQVYKKYGYHPKSLARWAEEGKIEYARSPGGHRRYLVSSLEKLGEEKNKFYYQSPPCHQQRDCRWRGKHADTRMSFVALPHAQNWVKGSPQVICKGKTAYLTFALEKYILEYLLILCSPQHSFSLALLLWDFGFTQICSY